MSNTGRELWKWRGGGNRGKPKAGFPPFPPPLGNPAEGFPLFHRPDDCSHSREAEPKTPIRKRQGLSASNRVNRTDRV